MAVKGRPTKYGIEGIGNTELDLGDETLNRLNAENGVRIGNELAMKARQNIIDNERYISAHHEEGDRPVLMNTVENTAAYDKARQFFESMKGGTMDAKAMDAKLNELNINAKDFSSDFGHAYLDYTSAGIARGDISSRDASQAYNHMMGKFNPGFASMNANVERTHVVLFPEHYQYLDPKTRETMDPALRLRAAQDIARLETIAGGSLAGADGQLRTTLEKDLAEADKWPSGHESAITKDMAAANKKLEQELTQASSLKKSNEIEPVAPEKRSGVGTSSDTPATPTTAKSEALDRNNDTAPVPPEQRNGDAAPISAEVAAQARGHLDNMANNSGVKAAGLPANAPAPEMGQSAPPITPNDPAAAAQGAAIVK